MYILFSIYTTSLGFLIAILNFSSHICYFLLCLTKMLHSNSAPFLYSSQHPCSNSAKLRRGPSRAPALYDSSAGTHTSGSCISERLVKCQNDLFKPYTELILLLECWFAVRLYIQIRDFAIINGGRDKCSSAVHSSLKNVTARQQH